MLMNFHQNTWIHGKTLSGLKLLEGLIGYDFAFFNPTDTLSGMSGNVDELGDQLTRTWEMLKTDGAMAVYVTERHYASLRTLLDCICGTDNYVDTFVINKDTSERLSRFSFLMVYQKSEEFYYKNPVDYICRTKAPKSIHPRSQKLHGKIRRARTIESWIAQSPPVYTEKVSATQTNRETQSIYDPILFEKILSIFTNSDSMILNCDSNAGTLLRAMMQLNHSDQGKRTFTMITEQPQWTYPSLGISERVNPHYPKLRNIVLE